MARFPTGIDFLEMAPIICAGVTVYKGLRQTDTKPGEWVAISGVGGLGHLAVQYAKAMGLHGVLVTAPSPIAFKQGLSALRRKGTISLNGLPPGSFDLPIFETVLNGYTVRGSIVGTRKDMQEAVAFAIEGKVKATVHAAKMENINCVFDEMKKGEIDGRIVLDIAVPESQPRKNKAVEKIVLN